MEKYENPGWICISGSTVFYRDKVFGKLAKGFYFRIIQGLSRDEKILDAPTFVLFCSTFPKAGVTRVRRANSHRVVLLCVLSYP